MIPMPWSPALCALLALAVACATQILLQTWARHQLSLSKHHHLRRSQLLRDAGLDVEKAQLAGFFHPYCDAGGGGERVLWTAIAALQREQPQLLCLVYTGDDLSKQSILQKVKDRFNIHLDARTLHIVHLSKRRLVEDATWPRFTLLGQSLGSVLLAWEALTAVRPDYFVDTMGYAFTYPLARWAGLRVASYTHYPTISADMVRRVQTRQAGHTNPSEVAASAVKSEAKLRYYQAFMFLYSLCLAQADVVMANSTWTYHHLKQILGPQAKTLSVVYPPCDVHAFLALPIDQPRAPIFLSVAQFRPEKEQAVQIQALKLLLSERRTALGSKTPTLVLAGSVRNEQDGRRVEGLKVLARQLGVENDVHFVVNAPFTELLSWFGQATAGLSTMVDEHFGINVVELMAAGVVPIAHPSAGPLLDIVVPFQTAPTGLLASTPQEFADAMNRVLSMPQEQLASLRANSRASVLSRFSVAVFEKAWQSQWDKMVKRWTLGKPELRQ